MTFVDPGFEYFLAAYELGSINAAARSLFVSPSAVSRQVARLEKEAGATFFERAHAGVLPTPAGTAFAGYVRRVLRETAACLDALGSLKGEVKVLSVATTSGLIHQLVPTVLRQFRADHPNVSFRIEMTDPRHASQRVRQGSVDVAVTFTLADEPGVEVNFTVPAETRAVMSPGHPLAARSSVSIREVARYPLALLPHGNTNRILFEAFCQRNEIHLMPSLECDSPAGTLEYLQDSDTIALLSEIAVLKDLSAGTVVAVDLDEPDLGARSLQVQTRQDHELDPVTREFVGFLSGRLASLSPQAG